MVLKSGLIATVEGGGEIELAGAVVTVEIVIVMAMRDGGGAVVELEQR